MPLLCQEKPESTNLPRHGEISRELTADCTFLRIPQNSGSGWPAAMKLWEYYQGSSSVMDED